MCSLGDKYNFDNYNIYSGSGINCDEFYSTLGKGERKDFLMIFLMPSS